MFGKSMIPPWHRPLVLVGVIFLLVDLSAVATSHPSPYQRIVSINLAADEIVLQLAPPEHIVALSRLASDPELSRLADRAAHFPSADSSVEGILRLQPDIVFASQYTSRNTSDLLEKFGITVVRLPEANNLDDCRALVRQVGDILQLREKSGALVEDMDSRLLRLQQKIGLHPTRPTALVYGQGGYTQGADTLLHHILEAAGLRNHASSFNISGQTRLPLESLLLSPPDFLILLPYHPNDPTLGSMLADHRALRRLPTGLRVVEIPLGWTLAGNNLTVRTAEYLWEQIEAALPQPQP
jgi:iron complex transport system substrate-binding protein